MGKVLSWLAGLAAVVLGGYLVWYLTNPHTTTFEGMVYSENSQVSKAMVTLQISGDGPGVTAYHDFTDENGSYHFQADSLSRNAKVVLIITANGYRAQAPVYVETPLKSDNRVDVALTPSVTPHPAPFPGPGPVIPHPGSLPIVPRYLPKSFAVKIPAK